MRSNPFGFAVHNSSLTGVLILLAPAWVLWILTGVLLNAGLSIKSHLPVIVRSVMEYGKVKKTSRKETILNGTLPKRYFVHFYIWGSMWIGTVTVVYFYRCFSLPIPSFKLISVLDDVVHFATGGYLDKCSVITRHHVDVAVLLSMLSVQVLRRLYECLCVSMFSSSARIHLVHYILGMFFYPAVAFTSLLHLDSVGDAEISQAFSLSFSHWTILAIYSVSILVFLWASVHQYRCHKILADLRWSKTDSSYHLPRGDWFELVSSPHFMAEVLIYSSMLLVAVAADVWTVWWLVMVYTVSTLGLSARQTHIWYKDKFEDYPRNRYAMIPFCF